MQRPPHTEVVPPNILLRYSSVGACRGSSICSALKKLRLCTGLKRDDCNLSLRRATIGQALTAPDHAIDDNNSLRCWRVLTPMIAAVTKSGAIAADNAACGDQFWLAPPLGLRRISRTKSPILR